MKAQEYFEKYFSDLDIYNLEQIDKTVKEMVSEFASEIKQLAEQRKSEKNSVAVAIVNEQNAKWNSVAAKVEKKFGFPVLKRNSIYNVFLHTPFPDIFPEKPDC